MATEVTSLRHCTGGELPRRQTTLLIEATVDTDANGDGDLSINFEDEGGRSFADTPFITFDETSDPAAEVSAVDATALDLAVSGSSTTDGTATVRAIIRGRHD